MTESAALAGAPPAFHLLAKPTGAVCNLNCTYCFFLSKETLYPGSHFRMTDEVLELYIKQLLEAHRTPEVTIAWQGGEPTMMGLDFFRKAVALAEHYRRPGQQVVHTIQTNGTLIDDEWAAFFKEQNVLIGVSIDGPREIHDTYRVNKGGRGSFDQVMRGFAALKRHQVDFNILCTVHAANAHMPLELYRFFRDDLGANFLQFIPIIERATQESLPIANIGWGARPGELRPLYTQEGSLVTERSVGAEQYGDFLIAIFDEWIRNDIGDTFVQIFDATLGAYVGQSSLCIFAPTCGDALALEHTGDVYSCDHYVEPDYLLGNITDQPLSELVALPEQRTFGQNKADSLPPQCQECEVRFACNGGCPRNRFITTADGEPGLNYLCAGYKKFFNHVDRSMRRMAWLLRAGQDAADIQQEIRKADALVLANALATAGRNEPCPCGSGKKVKHCHGDRGLQA